MQPRVELYVSSVVVLLLEALPLATAHGHGEPSGMDVDIPPATMAASRLTFNSSTGPQSYFELPDGSNLIYTHIVLMTIAWFFVLPVAVMLSLARSRLTLLVQTVFLILNASGLLVGTTYNARTPDLYPNNLHHKLGWVITWMVSAQALVGLLNLYTGRFKQEDSGFVEREALMPSMDVIVERQRLNEEGHDSYRYSIDSGQGTERESSSLRSHSLSPTHEHPERQLPGYQAKLEAGHDADEETVVDGSRESGGFLQNSAVDRFLLRKVPGVLSTRVLGALNAFYAVVDRAVLPLAFVLFLTGAVTFAGIVQGINVFNGLAHFIKGGIFFWYGILTLGRWMGCFADLGWAWNTKPPRDVVGNKASAPTAEFTESFVIWFYGTTNVFLEHLAAWGGPWTAQDLEHVSISIMFFGGGLCGMLVESGKIRNLLNITMLSSAPSQRSYGEASDAGWKEPRTYNTSLNPLPALIILLLGMMMGSHHQSSMVSTMVHKQWGMLLVGFSLARAVTYILFFLSPPASLLPSRPPSELVAAFCLISGGIIFMASNKDTVAAMERHELDAMFIFTVTMGFTAFLMAWEMLCVAIKGWAVRKRGKTPMMVLYDDVRT